MRLQTQFVVRLGRGQLLQPIRQSAALEDLAGTVGRLPQPVDRDEQLVRMVRLLGKLAGASIRLSRP